MYPFMAKYQYALCSINIILGTYQVLGAANATDHYSWFFMLMKLCTW